MTKPDHDSWITTLVYHIYHTSVPHSIRVLYQVVSSLTLFHVYLQSAHDTCSKCFLQIKWKQSFCGTFCILFESCDQYYWVFVITRCLVDRWFRSHCVIKWLGLSNKGLPVVCFIQTWPRLLLEFWKINPKTAHYGFFVKNYPNNPLLKNVCLAWLSLSMGFFF